MLSALRRKIRAAFLFIWTERGSEFSYFTQPVSLLATVWITHTSGGVRRLCQQFLWSFEDVFGRENLLAWTIFLIYFLLYNIILLSINYLWLGDLNLYCHGPGIFYSCAQIHAFCFPSHFRHWHLEKTIKLWNNFFFFFFEEPVQIPRLTHRETR